MPRNLTLNPTDDELRERFSRALMDGLMLRHNGGEVDALVWAIRQARADGAAAYAASQGAPVVKLDESQSVDFVRMKYDALVKAVREGLSRLEMFIVGIHPNMGVETVKGNLSGALHPIREALPRATPQPGAACPPDPPPAPSTSG